MRARHKDNIARVAERREKQEPWGESCRQTDRQADRQAYRQTDRQTDGHTDTHRDTDRHTVTGRERCH